MTVIFILVGPFIFSIIAFVGGMLLKERLAADENMTANISSSTDSRDVKIGSQKENEGGY